MKQWIVILLWVIYAASIIVLQNILSGIEGVVVSFIIFILLPLSYRYFFYMFCDCCEKAASITPESNNEVRTRTSIQTETSTHPLIEDHAEEETQNQPTITSTTSSPQCRVRYAFLDNIKVFLTAIVVSFHIAGNFAPMGYIPVFTEMLFIFLDICQAYFMTLFFFISAFFTPSSYAKRREKFLRRKRKRILLPALFVTLIISPVLYLFKNRYYAGEWTGYRPDSAQVWFLYWLLVFDWVYMSIIESTDTTSSSSSTMDNNDITEVERTEGREETQMPFPSTWTRLFYGVLLCGLVLDSFRRIIPQGILASMPTPSGSFTADFLMFYTGILAKKNGWLDRDLGEQLDIPLYIFFPLVFMEGAAYGVCKRISGPMPPLFHFVMDVILGAFCVDMNLAVLIIFQRWFNYETKLSKILARSAYCVYLIHNVIILATTLFFLEMYHIVFGSDEGAEVGRIVGGFIFVIVATHAVVWPLSYGLTQLSILCDII